MKQNKSQSGRSMVEMLGVLAIIGVLSVGGITGYKYAMNKIQLNKVLEVATLAMMSLIPDDTIYESMRVSDSDPEKDGKFPPNTYASELEATKRFVEAYGLKCPEDTMQKNSFALGCPLGGNLYFSVKLISDKVVYSKNIGEVFALKFILRDSNIERSSDKQLFSNIIKQMKTLLKANPEMLELFAGYGSYGSCYIYERCFEEMENPENWSKHNMVVWFNFYY